MQGSLNFIDTYQERGHPSNRQNEKWLLLSASFTPKFELFLVLTRENAFSLWFYFKTNRKSIGSSKKLYQKLF